MSRAQSTTANSAANLLTSLPSGFPTTQEIQACHVCRMVNRVFFFLHQPRVFFFFPRPHSLRRGGTGGTSMSVPPKWGKNTIFETAHRHVTPGQRGVFPRDASLLRGLRSARNPGACVHATITTFLCCRKNVIPLEPKSYVEPNLVPRGVTSKIEVHQNRKVLTALTSFGMEQTICKRTTGTREDYDPRIKTTWSNISRPEIKWVYQTKTTWSNVIRPEIKRTWSNVRSNIFIRPDQSD